MGSTVRLFSITSRIRTELEAAAARMENHLEHAGIQTFRIPAPSTKKSNTRESRRIFGRQWSWEGGFAFGVAAPVHRLVALYGKMLIGPTFSMVDQDETGKASVVRAVAGAEAGLKFIFWPRVLAVLGLRIDYRFPGERFHTYGDTRGPKPEVIQPSRGVDEGMDASRLFC